MKTLYSFSPFLLLAVVIILTFGSCKKSDTAGKVDAYTSMSDFYTKNAVPVQEYTIDAAFGGNFTSPQGTIVSIGPNNFRTASGTIVTGPVAISFRDIYKKSDMLLSDIPTVSFGRPIKSGGEFFILAKAADTPVQIRENIEIRQPADGPVDSAMAPFIGLPNLQDQPFQWVPGNDSVFVNAFASVTFSASQYVFSLYQFQSPYASGTWCNSDNPYYFSAYPTTTLTIHGTNIGSYGDVFLVFKDVNSMIHVYTYSNHDYIYSYAPLGLKCTVVAVDVKDGKLYSSFTPITISNNQALNFTLQETTTDDFKTALDLLN